MNNDQIAKKMGFEYLRKRTDKVTGKKCYIGYKDRVGYFLCYSSEYPELKKKIILDEREKNRI